MADSREEHWRDVAEDGEDKSKIRALRWYVYIKDKYELIKRIFLVVVPHPKGGNIVWTSVKVIPLRKRSTKNLLNYISLVITYLKKRRVGGLRGVIWVSLF